GLFVALIGACAFAAYEYASPYIAVYQIQEAIRSKDAVALTAYVDFAQLRDSLKRSISAAALDAFNMNGRPGGDTAQASLIFGNIASNAVIDSLVTPENVAQALEYGDSQSGGGLSSTMQY